MNSQEIVEKYNVKLNGQQLLFADYDICLRNAPFLLFNADKEESQKILINWWMNVYFPDGSGENRTDFNVYQTYSHALYKYFNYAKADGCYNRETNQSIVSFTAYKKHDLIKQYNELSLWIPYIKTQNDKDGKEYKYIGVIDRTLSEGGIYQIHIYDDYVQFGITRWGHYDDLKRFDNLLDCVKYIQKEKYYE